MNTRKSPQIESLSDDAINAVCERLLEKDGHTESLPGNSHIHNDRPLPFLAVYRRPVANDDLGTEDLISGEASYLIISGDPKLQETGSKLIRCLVKQLTKKFSAVLIVEIWAVPPIRNNSDQHSGITRPKFRIMTSGTRPPTRTIEALVKSLEAIKLNRKRSTVDVLYRDSRCPCNMSPLIQVIEARKLNCW